MKKTQYLLAGALMASLTLPAAYGAVTPYSWIRSGEFGIMTDSSGQTPPHPFNAAFSSGCEGGAGGGGLTAAVTSQNAVGGPLGTSGAISTTSTEWGFFNCGNSGMWIQGPNNSVPPPEQWSLPATNWVVEAWVLPIGDGASGGGVNSQFLSTGSSQFGGTPGGVAFRTTYNFEDETVTIGLYSIGQGAGQVGDSVIHDKKQWMHVAAVNDNGVTTFYVNGVAQGEPSSTVSAPSGVPYIGSGQDTGQPFKGLLDEIRFSTFAPGAFQVSDLLLRPPGPGFISQPESMSVWTGGAAPFIVNTVFDESTTYQWKKGDADIQGATGPEYLIPSVTAGDSGSVYKVVVTTAGGTATTPDATLTVVPNQTDNNNFYRAAINAEVSLAHYFPIDGSTADTIANTKTAAATGTLQGGTSYDGRIDRSYGERALRFQGNGSVTLAPDASLEFGDKTGTIEALVYTQRPKVDGPQTIFSLSSEDATFIYYSLQVSQDGTALTLTSDESPQGAAWAVTPPLLNRFAHIALVFNNDKVTAYVDGVSLGAKDAPVSSSTGLGAYIGSTGASGRMFNGTIDELAIYGDALSDNTIAIHNSRFVYGTAVTAPEITAAPTGTWNLLAGGAPVFRVTASGTAPLSYQWKLNGAPILNNASATTATLMLTNTTVESTGQYTVTVTNPIGDDTSDPFTVNFTAPAANDKYAALVLADDPTAYWRLHESNESVTLKDYAGGFDGTYSTTVVRGVEGAPGTAPDTAARFAGEGSPTPNAVVPFTPILNPTGPFSIEFWAKPNVSGNIGRAVLGTQNRNTGRAGYAVYQGFNVNGWEAHLGYAETVLFIQGQTPPVAGRWDHVVVTWDGVNTARIFVNGKDDTNPGSTVNGPHRPNTAQPLEIGSRFNGTVPYNGTIDEVAFYNYKLTPEQIEKHFSIAFVPSSVTTQPPATLSGTEADTVTISVNVAGFPNTYQWFKDGVALEETTNPDGTPHYPSATLNGVITQGINGSSLVIAHATPADNGVYQLKVTNPLGNSETITTTVTIAPDLSAPTVVKVAGTANTNVVQVTFNKPMLAETVSVASNYTLTGGASVESVVLTTDPRVVNLVTTGVNANTDYTLSITGVKDQRANQNVIGANSTTFKTHSLKTGVIAWSYYKRAGSIDEWLVDPMYPNGALHERFLTNFSTSEITINNDLSNNPDFGPALGSDYGGRVFGWLTPKVTGDYQFFLRSDDASQLRISADADPANLGDIIAIETGCCDPFKVPSENDPDPAETSEFITLEAGKSYFIEAVYKEGQGGDYVEVAWRNSDTGTPTIIPGEFLSAYAPASRAQFNPPTKAANGDVTFTWTGTGVLEESTDLKTWSPVPGNPASGFTVTPTAGSMKFYRLKE